MSEDLVPSDRLEALGDRLEFVGAPIGFEELERTGDRAQAVFIDYLKLVRHPRPEVRGHERIEGRRSSE